MTPPERSRPNRRIGRKLLLAACAFLAADQAVNWLVLGVGPDGGWLAGRRIAPFDPPIFMEVQKATIERLAQPTVTGMHFGDVDFDARTGWSTPAAGTSEDVTWCGARAGGPEVAKERTPTVRRAAAFGCSFTFGSEVAGNEAWPAVVHALRQDLEVQNFGVPGFGLDQALLHYERIADREDADVALGDAVWVGFLPATLLRLVSVYRPALRHYTTTVAVKPRFRLGDDGRLERVPNPAHSLGDLVDLLQHPERRTVLTRTDGYMLAAPVAYARRGSHPLHWFATTRLLVTALERSGRDWAARAEDPDDECRRLAIAILEEFRRRVVASDRQFHVVLLPDRASLGPATKPWDALVEALRAASIDVVDVTDRLETAGAAADESMWAPNGHYSATANRLVAEHVAEMRG